MRFRDLSIGQSFDWINPAKPGYNSFFLRCVKVSIRCYTDSEGYRHEVGSLNAAVYHVEVK